MTVSKILNSSKILANKLILNTNVDFDICLSRIMNMRLLRMVAFLLKGQNVDLDSEFHHFQDPIVVFLD